MKPRLINPLGFFPVAAATAMMIMTAQSGIVTPFLVTDTQIVSVSSCPSRL